MFGKITRRMALVIVGLLVFATPAFASLVVQNYLQADIQVGEACFVKVGGQDAISYVGTDPDDPLASFSDDPTDPVDPNTITVDGVNLLEERLTVRGMRGDRVTYTDVVRYQNNCEIPLEIQLIATAGNGTGDWSDRSARIYLSSTPVAVGGTPTLGFPGTAGSGWDLTPIVVEANTGAILPGNSQTGTVLVGPGEEIRGAITVSAGVNSTTTGIGTVNWVAQAVNQN